MLDVLNPYNYGFHFLS